MATYTKISATVTVYVNGVDDPFVISAAGVAEGAWNALLSGRDVLYNDGNQDVFIPFHAVTYATRALSTSEATKPVDDNCQ